MKKLLEFLKTSAQGGLFVLLPLLLLWLLLGEILGLIVTLATPIADLFPQDMFEDLSMPNLVALILLTAVSFLLGLVLRSEYFEQLWNRFDQNVIGRLPLYNALKRLTKGFYSTEEGCFIAALYHTDENTSELVYLIEKIDDQRSVILVPWAPTSFAGSVKIVKSEQLELLSDNIGNASRVLSHWGVGMKSFIDESSIGQQKSS